MEDIDDLSETKKRIYIIGPSIKAQGGISSVLKIYDKYYKTKFNYCFISSYFGSSLLKNIALFIVAVIRVIYVCITDNYAIFHIHTSIKGSYVRKSIIARICIFFKRKVIVHIHSGKFDRFLEDSSSNKKYKVIKLLEKAQKIIVLTSCWKQYLSKYIEISKIEVIHNPVVVNLYSEKTIHSKTNICFVGKLSENKGIYDLIHAAKRLNIKNYIINLYGDGEINKVQNTLKKEGMEDFFVVHGWIKNELMKEIYANNDILVLPSYYEGLPLSVLEGMANGLPIISTIVGGIPEAITNGYNGYLIKPGDVNELALVMEKLINNLDLRKKFGSRSVEIIIEKFSVDKVEEQLMRLYKEVNKRHR